MLSKKMTLTSILVLGAFWAMAAFGGDGIIYSGIDPWRTPADGATYADFASDPLPADFFCAGSAPFTGRIAFRGEPIATSPPDLFGDADTIIHRLDDAPFNHRDVARTRVQVRALALTSIEPLDAGCGLYHARVSLKGEQPVTEMKIVRDRGDGGRFLVPLHLNVEMVFTPVDGRSEGLAVFREIRFEANPDAPWSFPSRKNRFQYDGYALIDTDGDRTPDTFVPGTSNFAPGKKDPKLSLPRIFEKFEEENAGTEVESESAGDCGICHCDPDATNPDEVNQRLVCTHIHCPTGVIQCAY